MALNQRTFVYTAIEHHKYIHLENPATRIQYVACGSDIDYVWGPRSRDVEIMFSISIVKSSLEVKGEQKLEDKERMRHLLVCP